MFDSEQEKKSFPIFLDIGRKNFLLYIFLLQFNCHPLSNLEGKSGF